MTIASDIPRITLRPEKQGTFLAHHPWVLVSSLVGRPKNLQTGDVADLVLPDGRFIGRGLFHESSRICLRLYSWDKDAALDDAFWQHKLEQAVALRTELELDDPHGAARLIYSEGDDLSGLIVDRYGQYLVVQFTAQVIYQRADMILSWLKERLRPAAIQVRVDGRVARAEKMEPQQTWVHGEPPTAPIEIMEHGIRLQLDLNESQKTGYYLDQRDNRHAAAKYLRGRSVLDVCCYLGGFSLAAARAGAGEILALDTSPRAIELARKHAELNGVSNIQFAHGDCFEQLETFVQTQRK
ncbi:MAG: class I SAM-dependent rRNA methyltransferase, partial [Planctomycetales bacterium]|nr:class I SAM-dependent rRNA methyltransferase [Planctomycetales bacterium]